MRRVILAGDYARRNQLFLWPPYAVSGMIMHGKEKH